MSKQHRTYLAVALFVVVAAAVTFVFDQGLGFLLGVVATGETLRAVRRP